MEKIERLGEKGYRLITEKGDEMDCDWLIMVSHTPHFFRPG